MCPVCGLLLKAKESDLLKHIRVVHAKEKKIKCQFCREKFLYHRHLYRHQVEVHKYEGMKRKEKKSASNLRLLALGLRV